MLNLRKKYVCIVILLLKFNAKKYIKVQNIEIY